jgi:(2R)-sulfolactate sulfo-lyase subunit alpha
MRRTDFLVHAASDTVGVVVTEEVTSGKELTGWVMETDETLTVTAKDDIPLGHKLALGEIKSGDTIVKYGHDIGKAVADIEKGGHAHVHNVKTKRW